MALLPVVYDTETGEHRTADWAEFTSHVPPLATGTATINVHNPCCDDDCSCDCGGDAGTIA